MLRGAFWATLLWSVASSWGQAGATFSGPTFGADEVFQALAAAYPGWVSVRPGFLEPTLTVDGRDFVWAQGRLLPTDQASDWQKYAAQPFYPYPSQVPQVSQWTDDQIAEAETKIGARMNGPLRRNSAFFDTLWGIHDRGSADAAQKQVRFFGMKVTVHQTLEGPLGRVEARLRAARTQDASLDQFLKSLASLDGYNWRDIAGTQSRSNHAYGSAVDLIPRNFKDKTPYWLWSAQDGGPWYRRAWDHRWEPHPAVVAAFEAEGFLWGGKWLLFDTIHFEYRPEILILNKQRM